MVLTSRREKGGLVGRDVPHAKLGTFRDGRRWPDDGAARGKCRKAWVEEGVVVGVGWEVATRGGEGRMPS